MRDLQCQYRDIDQKAREIWPVQVILQPTILVSDRLLALSACISAPETNRIPHLWSGEKNFDFPPAACADRAFKLVTTLGLSEIVRNGDFVYANQGANRLAIKCVAQASGSFVYFAVAGADKVAVEKLRNEISAKL